MIFHFSSVFTKHKFQAVRQDGFFCYDAKLLIAQGTYDTQGSLPAFGAGGAANVIALGDPVASYSLPPAICWLIHCSSSSQSTGGSFDRSGRSRLASRT